MPGSIICNIAGMETLVVVGSLNPVKVQCVQDAFEAAFPGQKFAFRGVDAASGVSDQPMSDKETLFGAGGRATHARALAPSAQFWVGIEGGISDDGGQMEAFAWIVIVSEKRTSRARTATFPIPEKVAKLVRSGVELGLADDQVFGRSNSKQQDGAVGLLTHGKITRRNYYSHAVLLALIPFVNEQVFNEG